MPLRRNAARRTGIQRAGRPVPAAPPSARRRVALREASAALVKPLEFALLYKEKGKGTMGNRKDDGGVDPDDRRPSLFPTRQMAARRHEQTEFSCP